MYFSHLQAFVGHSYGGAQNWSLLVAAEAYPSSAAASAVYVKHEPCILNWWNHKSDDKYGSDFWKCPP